MDYQILDQEIIEDDYVSNIKSKQKEKNDEFQFFDLEEQKPQNQYIPSQFKKGVRKRNQLVFNYKKKNSKKLSQLDLNFTSQNRDQQKLQKNQIDQKQKRQPTEEDMFNLQKQRRLHKEQYQEKDEQNQRLNVFELQEKKKQMFPIKINYQRKNIQKKKQKKYQQSEKNYENESFDAYQHDFQAEQKSKKENSFRIDKTKHQNFNKSIVRSVNRDLSQKSLNSRYKYRMDVEKEFPSIDISKYPKKKINALNQKIRSYIKRLNEEMTNILKKKMNNIQKVQNKPNPEKQRVVLLKELQNLKKKIQYQQEQKKKLQKNIERISSAKFQEECENKINDCRNNVKNIKKDIVKLNYEIQELGKKLNALENGDKDKVKLNEVKKHNAQFQKKMKQNELYEQKLIKDIKDLEQKNKEIDIELRKKIEKGIQAKIDIQENKHYTNLAKKHQKLQKNYQVQQKYLAVIKNNFQKKIHNMSQEKQVQSRRLNQLIMQIQKRKLQIQMLIKSMCDVLKKNKKKTASLLQIQKNLNNQLIQLENQPQLIKPIFFRRSKSKQYYFNQNKKHSLKQKQQDYISIKKDKQNKTQIQNHQHQQNNSYKPFKLKKKKQQSFQPLLDQSQIKNKNQQKQKEQIQNKNKPFVFKRNRNNFDNIYKQNQQQGQDQMQKKQEEIILIPIIKTQQPKKYQLVQQEKDIYRPIRLKRFGRATQQKHDHYIATYQQKNNNPSANKNNIKQQQQKILENNNFLEVNNNTPMNSFSKRKDIFNQALKEQQKIIDKNQNQNNKVQAKFKFGRRRKQQQENNEEKIMNGQKKANQLELEKQEKLRKQEEKQKQQQKKKQLYNKIYQSGNKKIKFIKKYNIQNKKQDIFANVYDLRFENQMKNLDYNQNKKINNNVYNPNKYNPYNPYNPYIPKVQQMQKHEKSDDQLNIDKLLGIKKKQQKQNDDLKDLFNFVEQNRDEKNHIASKNQIKVINVNQKKNNDFFGFDL